MFLRRFLTFLKALGIVLVVLGLWLPWVNRSRPQGITPPLHAPSYQYAPLLGIDTLLGGFAFYGWLVATASWILFMVKGQKLLLRFIIAGDIAMMIFSLAALAYPGFWESPGIFWTASYGEYVSLAGGALILVGSILSSQT